MNGESSLQRRFCEANGAGGILTNNCPICAVNAGALPSLKVFTFLLSVYGYLLVGVTSRDLEAVTSIHAGKRTHLRPRHIHPMKPHPITVTRYRDPQRFIFSMNVQLPILPRMTVTNDLVRPCRHKWLLIEPIKCFHH